MRRKEKKIHEDQIKSPLQKLFVRRLQEEMKKQDVSDNALSARCDDLKLPVGQSSVSRITGGRQDPSLENIYALAAALGFAAAPWYLLMDAGAARREVIGPPEPPKPQNVANFPSQRKFFSPPSNSVNMTKTRRRKV